MKPTVLAAIILIITGFTCLMGVILALCKQRGMCCFGQFSFSSQSQVASDGNV